MKIEAIKLKNFKTFQNIEMKNIPKFCIIIGANGTGKSTLFGLFEFLKEALTSNINTALIKLGGNKGFDEVRSRGQSSPIEIEIKFRESEEKPIVTYELHINKENNKAFVQKEILKYRRGNRGKPWEFLNFSNGKGLAVTNESDIISEIITNDKELTRETQELKSNDILAIKGLAIMKKFPAIVALGNLIENWHISDFHINRARPEQAAGYAEHLSREGENLSLVIEYLHINHPKTFEKILNQLKTRIPRLKNVTSKTTEEGRVLLKFQNDTFKEPFLAQYVSDGTIKMLAYLTLLNDPNPHSLLCIEEPENQLYPQLLEELAEEFREYSEKGEQVFVSTHSPHFLNAAQANEVFWLEKEDTGYTKIKRASENEQIKKYMEEGDKMGYLWNEGLFGNIHPS